MNKNGLFQIQENIQIAKDTYKMILQGNTEEIKNPGQFINIKIEGLYLRRPISICDYDDDSITIIYKVIGAGTEKLSNMKKGEQLDILTGLGNGFNINCEGKKPLLIGGGVGIPPMYKLSKELIKNRKEPIAVLGFKSEKEMFFKKEFEDLGLEVLISTEDGSQGTKGFVTDIIKNMESYTYYYACGPIPMLKAIYNIVNVSGQLSLEERMGCGFGACMGCTIKTKNGNKRVCKEGPVFKKEELLW